MQIKGSRLSSAQLKKLLDFFIAMSAVLLLVVLSDSLVGREVPLRTLRGNDYDTARELRDTADRMRGELEGRLSGPPRTRPQISQEEIDAESAKIEQAYREVIERYPRTEIAAYCALRLSSYCASVDEAVEILERTAKEFAGTSEENKIIFELGLLHLQIKHEPAEAIKWFSRISKPDGDGYGMGDVLYLSAQQQLAKCELQLRQDADAQDRVTKLKESYSQYAQELERSYQFEVESRNNSSDEPMIPLQPKPRQSRMYRVVAGVVGAILIVIGISRLIFIQIRKRRKS